MKKMKSIFLCALGALSLAGCNSAAKGEKLVENDAKNDNPANVLNENVEVVLSYEDIFQQYYDLTVAKLNAQNKVVDFTIADFRDNYYESNLRLDEYVESYLSTPVIEESAPRALVPLRASGSSSDEKYILKGNISNPKNSDGSANPNFDPATTPTSAIQRNISYASSAAYNRVSNGDIVIETHTSQFNMGHAAFVYNTTKNAAGKLSGRSTYIQTIEAVGGGVQFGFLDDDRMTKFGVVIVRPKDMYGSTVSNAKYFIYEQLGKPYYLPTSQGSYQTSLYSAHWYCSELVYAAYYYAGKTIASPTSGGWIWPWNIQWSNKVEFVSYNNTLDIEYMGKTNGKFKLRIYNKTGSTQEVYYNSKKCFKDDAKNWKNLSDYQNNHFSLQDGKSKDVLISSNWFADAFAVSFVSNSKRYITYASDINDSTLRMSIYKNVKNA